jgi:HAD superfamily hydrolase (TIGR01450 family)
VSEIPPLLAAYDALLVDLDGVVQLGATAIPGAADALRAARAAGIAICFVTNNASRPAADVAKRLSDLGVDATPAEVMTSSMAAAALLAERLPTSAAVLVVGGEGLRQPITAAGLRPVETAADNVAAVAQGWSPDLTWSLLAEGAIALHRCDVLWVATNLDLTLPSDRGILPGNGSMVQAVANAVGREPITVGKPEPGLFQAAARRVGATRPLVVGDRLDTDIAGARRAGFDALLVLTGVSSRDDAEAAAEDERPTYIGDDLRAILAPGMAF